MSIPIFCPTCQKTYAVRDELRGRQVRCPAGHLLTVPATADPPPVEPDEPPAAPRSGTLIWALFGGGVLTLVLLAGATVAVLVYLQNRSAPEPTAVAALPPPPAPAPKPEPPPDAPAAASPAPTPEPREEPKPPPPAAAPSSPSSPPPSPPAPPPPARQPTEERPPEQRSEGGLIGRVNPRARQRTGPPTFLEMADRITRVDSPPPPVQRTEPPTPEVWDGHTSHVRGVAYTDDGQYVISVSGDVYEDDGKEKKRRRDNSVRLWDPRRGKQVHKVEGFKEAIDGVSLSPGGRFAVFGYGGHWEGDTWVNTKDHDVKLWDLQEKKEVPGGMPIKAEGPDWLAAGSGARFRGLDSTLMATAFAPDRTRIIGAANNGSIVLWDNVRGDALHRGTVTPFGFRTRGISSLKFTLDSRYIIMACADTTVRVYEASTGRQLGQLTSHQDIVWAVDVTETSDGRVLAISGGGSRMADNGKGFVDGARDYAIRVWDLNTGKALRRLSGHEKDVLALAFCPNARHCVSASLDKTVRLWDVETGRQLRLLGRHDGTARAVAVAPDGKAAVSGGDDAKVRFWRLPASADELLAALDKNDGEAFIRTARDADVMAADLVPHFTRLVKALGHTDATMRQAAVGVVTIVADYCEQAQRPSFDRTHVADLVKLLAATDAGRGRVMAARALGKVGADAREAAPILVGAVQADGETDLVAAVVEALGQIGATGPDVVAALERALKHREATVRARSATALAALGPSAIRLSLALELLASEADREVIAAAEKAVRARLTAPTAQDLPALKEGLKSAKGVVCVCCADGVARLGVEARDALPEVMALLKRKEREARLAAVRACRALGEAARPAIDELAALTEGSDRALAIEATGAVHAIDPTNERAGRKGVLLLLRALKTETMPGRETEEEKRMAAEAVSLLRGMGDAVVDPLFEELWQQSDKKAKPLPPYREARAVKARGRMYEVVKGLAESPKPPRKLKDWKNRLSLHLTNEKQLAQQLPSDPLVREVREAAQGAYNAVSGLKE